MRSLNPVRPPLANGRQPVPCFEEARHEDY